jgi:hypothetical protein
VFRLFLSESLKQNNRKVKLGYWDHRSKKYNTCENYENVRGSSCKGALKEIMIIVKDAYVDGTSEVLNRSEMFTFGLMWAPFRVRVALLSDKTHSIPAKLSNIYKHFSGGLLNSLKSLVKIILSKTSGPFWTTRLQQKPV